MNRGLLQAALAYAMWGLFPLFFRRLATTPALEIVVHRSVWSLAVVAVVLTVSRRWGWLRAVGREPAQLARFFASALLLSTNWLVYVWAVNHGRVLDASLGYFINPLVNVLLGALVLHERLRRVQTLAVLLAAAGVAWLTWRGGQVPWVALALAVSFGLYGLMRKTAALGSLEGLALETLLLAPLSLSVLAVWTVGGQGAVATALEGGSAEALAWLAASGPLTALPLLLFAAGARRLTLATLGLMQYIAPTLQFGLGVWLYGEPFDAMRLAGFGLIWAALGLYSAEGLWRARQARQAENENAGRWRPA